MHFDRYTAAEAIDSQLSETLRKADTAVRYLRVFMAKRKRDRLAAADLQRRKKEEEDRVRAQEAARRAAEAAAEAAAAEQVMYPCHICSSRHTDAFFHLLFRGWRISVLLSGAIHMLVPSPNMPTSCILLHLPQTHAQDTNMRASPPPTTLDRPASMPKRRSGESKKQKKLHSV